MIKFEFESPSEAVDTNTKYIAREVIKEEKVECDECHSTDIVVDNKGGCVVCQGCGLVLENSVIAEGSEWRTFEDDGSGKKDDRNRVGGPENALFAGFDLSTSIGAGGEDFKFSKYQKKIAMSSAMKSQLDSFKRIEDYAARLSLPRLIVNRAKELYKRIDESKEMKGKRRDTICAACIFIACRQSHVPRTLNELCAVSDLGKRDLSRTFSKIKKSKIYKKNKGKRKQRDSPAISLPRYCDQLNLTSHLFVKTATAIVDKLHSLAMDDGLNPATVCGASIGLVSKLLRKRRPVTRIAEVVHMAPITLQKFYRDVLYPRRSIFIGLTPELPAIKVNSLPLGLD